MKTTDFAKTLARYFSEYLPGIRNFSANTISSYRDTFRLILVFFGEKGIPPEKLDYKDFTAERITGFLEWLESSRGCTTSTRNQRLAAIHAFSRYAQTDAPERLLELQRILQIPTKRCPRMTVPHLTTEQVRILLEQPGQSTKAGRRDTVLLSLLYDTGARVQEICDIMVKDIRLASPVVATLTGKGRKTRVVPLLGNTACLLDAYMQENRLGGNGTMEKPLFFNQRGIKLTRGGISHILQKYAVQASSSISMPDKVTPHMLRHSKAMHLYQAGVDMVYIRDILGHADISTTDIYARADTESKRKALEKAYGGIPKQAFPDWTKDGGLMEFLSSL